MSTQAWNENCHISKVLLVSIVEIGLFGFGTRAGVAIAEYVTFFIAIVLIANALQVR